MDKRNQRNQSYSMFQGHCKLITHYQNHSSIVHILSNHISIVNRRHQLYIHTVTHLLDSHNLYSVKWYKVEPRILNWGFRNIILPNINVFCFVFYKYENINEYSSSWPRCRILSVQCAVC